MAEDKKKEIDVTVTEEYLKEKLYKIRGKRVLLDADDRRHHGHDDGKGKSQPGTVGHIFAHAHIISGTEFMGHGDGKSIADTHAETDDQEVDGAGRAYCCQIIHTKKPSYDHGIYQIIELLE